MTEAQMEEIMMMTSFEHMAPVRGPAGSRSRDSGIKSLARKIPAYELVSSNNGTGRYYSVLFYRTAELIAQHSEHASKRIH